MNFRKAAHSFALYFLVSLLTEHSEQHSFLTEEFPIGRASIGFPSLDNPAKTAVIVPAAAINYDGGCSLTKRFCWLKNAWGCTTWGEPPWVVATGCELHGLCSEIYGNCSTRWEYVGSWGYDDFECLCNSSTVTFTEERKNSKVDFRQKQTIFWELAVPPELENKEFLCKPGSSHYSFNTSQKESRTDFLCENAIGYFTQNENSTSNQTVMVIDLKDGDDEVYLGAHELPTRFVMGNDGNKIFHGGQRFNEFWFDSHCDGNLTGELVGGDLVINVIMISGNCSRGKTINLILIPDASKLVIGSNVNIIFSKIKVILLEGLDIKFDESEMWNLTLVHQADGWVSIGPNEAFGVTATFCGSEHLDWKDRILCTTWWQHLHLWIGLTSLFVCIGLCISLPLCVWIKTKRKSKNPSMAYEMTINAK